MKRFSEKAAAATIARILKKADKAREALHYTWIDDKGRQCALDGFRAFRLDTPIAGLPGLPANIQPFPLHTIYEKLAPMNMRELPRPEPDELAALAADDKKYKLKGGRYYEDDEKHVRGDYCFGEGLPVVNLEYLMDVYKVYPDAELYFENVVSPIYIKSQYGDGLLLPIRYMHGLNTPARREWKHLKPAAVKPERTPKSSAAYSLDAFAARFAPAA